MSVKKNISLLTISEILGNIFTFSMWFYLATLLAPSNYGEIFYILGIASISASFALLGHPYTMTVFTAKKIKIQSTLNFCSLVSAIIIGIILTVIFSRFELLLLIIGIVISSLASADLLGRKSFTIYSKYFITQKFSLAALVIGFYFLFDFSGILFGIGLSHMVYLPIIIRSFLQVKINFMIFRSNFKFTLNNYFLGLANVLKNEVDKIIIPAIISYSILGQYSLALQILNGLLILPGIMFKYFLPHDSSGIENTKIKKLSILVCIIIAIVASIFSPYVINEFFPNYSDSVDAFQIMSFSIIPLMFTGIITSELLAIEKNQFIIFSRMIVLILIISLMLVLGTTIGLIGISIAFLVANSGETIFLIIYKQKIKNEIKRSKQEK